MRCTICNPRFIDEDLCLACREKFLKCLKPRLGTRSDTKSLDHTKTLFQKFFRMFLSEYP